jgi:cytochrome c553
MGPIARTLSDRQMRDLAAYYGALPPAPSPAPTGSVRERQLGGAIAAAGVPAQGVPACKGCHGPDGAGQPPIYPALAGQYEPYTELQLMLWRQGRRSGDPLAIMERIAKAMTPEQIRAVATYYAGVHPAMAGAGRAVAPDVGAAPRASPANGSAGETPPYLDGAATGPAGAARD